MDARHTSAPPPMRSPEEAARHYGVSADLLIRFLLTRTDDRSTIMKAMFGEGWNARILPLDLKSRDFIISMLGFDDIGEEVRIFDVLSRQNQRDIADAEMSVMASGICASAGRMESAQNNRAWMKRSGIRMNELLHSTSNKLRIYLDREDWLAFDEGWNRLLEHRIIRNMLIDASIDLKLDWYPNWQPLSGAPALKSSSRTNFPRRTFETYDEANAIVADDSDRSAKLATLDAVIAQRARRGAGKLPHVEVHDLQRAVREAFERLAGLKASFSNNRRKAHDVDGIYPRFVREVFGVLGLPTPTETFFRRRTRP